MCLCLFPWDNWVSLNDLSLPAPPSRPKQPKQQLEEALLPPHGSELISSELWHPSPSRKTRYHLQSFSQLHLPESLQQLNGRNQPVSSLPAFCLQWAVIHGLVAPPSLIPAFCCVRSSALHLLIKETKWASFSWAFAQTPGELGVIWLRFFKFWHLGLKEKNKYLFLSSPSTTHLEAKPTALLTTSNHHLDFHHRNTHLNRD